MADNHIIATFDQAVLLRDALREYKKTHAIETHLYRTTIDKVLEAVEFTLKSDSLRTEETP